MRVINRFHSPDCRCDACWGVPGSQEFLSRHMAMLQKIKANNFGIKADYQEPFDDPECERMRIRLCSAADELSNTMDLDDAESLSDYIYSLTVAIDRRSL